MNKLVSDLRKRYGLPQKDMATIIGCSKGQVAMVETGRRALPSTCIDMLLLIENHAATEATAAPLADTAQTILSKKLSRMKLQLFKLDTDIIKLEYDMETEMQLYQLMATLLPLAESGDKLRMLSLNILQRKAAERYASNRELWLLYTIEKAGLEASIDQAMCFVVQV